MHTITTNKAIKDRPQRHVGWTVAALRPFIAALSVQEPMNILPKIGVDKIRLGMNKTQIKDVLGEPDEIENELNDQCWLYEQGLELSFKKDDLHLLGLVTVTSTSAQLDSEYIIGLNEVELIECFPYLVLEHDFEENGKDYVSAEKELSVWVSDGIVVNVTIFPEYEETGEIPLWPSFST